jgi:type II secretory pathway component GspD/PulD (secretin)
MMKALKKLLAIAALGLVFVGAPAISMAQGAHLHQIVEKVDLNQSDIRDALRMLFKDSKVSYSIDPDVQGQVTARFSGVTLEVALEALLRQIDATYRLESGMVFIVKKQLPQPAGPAPTTLPVQRGADKMVVRIPIQHIDPELLFRLLAGNRNVNLPSEISKGRPGGFGGGSGGFGGNGGGFGGGGGGGSFRG